MVMRLRLRMNMMMRMMTGSRREAWKRPLNFETAQLNELHIINSRRLMFCNLLQLITKKMNKKNMVNNIKEKQQVPEYMAKTGCELCSPPHLVFVLTRHRIVLILSKYGSSTELFFDTLFLC